MVSLLKHSIVSTNNALTLAEYTQKPTQTKSLERMYSLDGGVACRQVYQNGMRAGHTQHPVEKVCVKCGRNQNIICGLTRDRKRVV